MKKDKNHEYNFWNGKNLNGTQEYINLSAEERNDNECKCVIASETVSADDL